jgi:hypothetical protein
MNVWDLVTWLSSIALAGSAVGIFAFFLRDARSILVRDMHEHDEDPGDAPAEDPTPEQSA